MQASWNIPRAALALGALVLAGCAAPPAPPPASREALPVTPPAEVPSAPVARVPVPTGPGAVAPPAPAPGAPLATAPLVFPPGVLYLCVTEGKAGRQQTAIEFAPKVGELCRRHPEMGPCQYERNACRRAGGRVFASNGAEITIATEAEYDKKVLRVRFRGD